jgi:DNA replicative helicase MCM subunit Mcm2 (Cdc46/Mcm family)
MAEGERALQETLVININHVKWHDNDLAEQIEIEWLRLEPRLRQAVQRLVREVAPEFVKGDDQNEREFFIAWEGFSNIERLRDLRSAKVRRRSNLLLDSSCWRRCLSALLCHHTCSQ